MTQIPSGLSIPGKVFIAGEYLAVKGGPALLAAIEPRFFLSASRVEAGQGRNPFHENSLAGKYWLKHRSDFQDEHLHFHDPHQSQGGFGASTAEFALLHAWRARQASLDDEAQASFDWKEMWQDYRALAKEAAGSSAALPSGADLISQLKGNLTLFDRNHGIINHFSWLFPSLGLLFFRTGRKLPTHEHLQSLSDFPIETFEAAMKNVLLSLQTTNGKLFVEAISQYAQELLAQGFVSPATQEILQKAQHPAILAKKGCGAMGADVICLIDRKDLTASASRSEIIETMQGLGCTFIGNESCLSPGLRLESSFRFKEEVRDC